MGNLREPRRSRAVRPLLAAAFTIVVGASAAAIVATGSAAPKTPGTSAAVQYAPVSTSPPTISGNAAVGQTLTTTAGGWSNSPTAYAYRWQRCDSAGGNCADIPGAQSATYRVTSSDAGRRLRVNVFASNNDGSASRASAPTGVIPGTTTPTPTPTPTPAPAGTVVDVASLSLPQRLVIDRIEFRPSAIRSRTEPLVGRFHVVDSSGRSVRNALVYVVGVPFDRLSAAPEVRTDGAGWAQLTFAVKPTFSLSRGGLVVMFVRARKQGENVLGGISTRRLVSVRVSR